MIVRYRAIQGTVTALALIAATAMGAPAASAAKPDPHPAATIIGHEAVPAESGSKSLLVSECTTFGNPDPQFSASNSTFHWGVRSNCSGGTVASQQLTATLYAVVGNGDNQHNVWEDGGSSSSVTWHTEFTKTRSCLNRVTGRWTIYWRHSAVWSTGATSASEGWSNPSVFTIGCAEIS